MTDYAGNASGSGVPHTTIPLVDDSMPPTAMYFNPALEALADNDAYLVAAVTALIPQAALISHKVDGVSGGTYAPAAPVVVNGAGVVKSRNGHLNLSLNGSTQSFNASSYEQNAIYSYQLFTAGTNTKLFLNGSTDPTPPTNGRTMRFTSVGYPAQSSGGYTLSFLDTDTNTTIAQLVLAASAAMSHWWIEFVYNKEGGIYTTDRWTVSAWSPFWDAATLVTA